MMEINNAQEFFNYLVSFLAQAQDEGWPMDLITEQIGLVRDGVRDGRLKDLTCAALLPGVSW